MYIYTNNSNAIYYYCERYWEVKQYNYYSGIVNIERKKKIQSKYQRKPFLSELAGETLEPHTGLNTGVNRYNQSWLKSN